MGWREKLARYGPRLGVLVIALFVLAASVCVAARQRQQYQHDTFDVYLADTAPARAERQAQLEAIPAAQTAEDGRIYAAPHGKRYHSDPQCPGKNSREITWDDAAQRGLMPCKRCVKQ